MGDDGNWVRVGDPNQAIFETFTTANPELLRAFIRNNASIDMPESGRCQPSVMQLANFLIEWTRAEHPVAAVRPALSRPLIRPAPPGDPQPNPPDDPLGILLLQPGLSPEDEIGKVVRSLGEWLPTHQDRTVAVLCATNDHAANVVKALQQRKLGYRELLRSTSPTRVAAGTLSHVLNYLASPESSSKLAQTYRVWRRAWRDDKEHATLYADVAGLIAKNRRVEDLLSPEGDFPAAAQAAVNVLPDADKAEVLAELQAFRHTVNRWSAATVLPIDQLMLTVSGEVFSDPADLAVAHKLALVLRQISDENRHWRLPELLPHLKEIALNERRFIGFSKDDAGFDPRSYKGVVVVATMHKAKGLEWDRVYLTAINNYDFPSAQPGDQFIAEKWFLRDGLNLEAEALEQLRCVTSDGESDFYKEFSATAQARVDYARERLRLLYVGITRARQELILSWNTGRRGNALPALPLAAIQGWLEHKNSREHRSPERPLVRSLLGLPPAHANDLSQAGSRHKPAKP